MNIGNTDLAGNVVLLVVVAVFVVAGLAVSLIAITLTSIKESGGRTPQWPVSWPEPPSALARKGLEVPPVRADPPARQVPRDLGDGEGEPGAPVSPTPRVEIPRQRLAPHRP
ncbi:hypothetical protein, partial [Streptosporangium sp. NPDC048865]|uniref:hypothetical protein n=1 Tax=Streptosporangium sp. NPDC048865 TaxID=3155766 RepID=UPI00341B0092